MAFNTSTAKTRRFIDYWVYAPSAIALCLLFLSLFSSSIANTLIMKRISAEEEAVKVDTIDLKPSKVGALRINVKSSFGNRQNPSDWIVYEIQLRDRNGEIIAAAIDQDWQESGTWYEDGQSGTWRESDSSGEIDLRAIEGEQIDVYIQVLERAENAGVNLAPVLFDVKIEEQVLNSRALGWGALSSSILALFSLWVGASSGQKVIKVSKKDSDPQAREMLGGKDNLLQVYIFSRLDKNAPRRVQIELSINNEYGQKIYRHCHQATVKRMEDSDGNFSYNYATFTSFLVIEPYSSYRFKVDIVPDGSVDGTSLIVRQNCQTFKQVEVTTISDTP